MDAFYASIEQRDFPQYRGKPLVVGRSQKRGVIAAASYEARKYGVYSAMPSLLAKKKCPHLIFAESRFDVYRRVSQQIMNIFHEYTDLVEPLSLDEAFLDVTHNLKGLPNSATIIAKELKNRIKEETQLTASAGISYNKFLAKIASDYDKPDGIYVIEPAVAEDFIEKLPVKNFFGVGKVTAEKMHRLGIFTGADLKKMSEAELMRLFGKIGGFYYHIVRGIDNRPVNPHRIRKSVGREMTFHYDLRRIDEVISHLNKVIDRLEKRLEKTQFKGTTLTVKIKFSDFKQITRSRTFPDPITNIETIRHIAADIIRAEQLEHFKIRLLGITLSNAMDYEKERAIQLTIPFPD